MLIARALWQPEVTTSSPTLVDIYVSFRTSEPINPSQRPNRSTIPPNRDHPVQPWAYSRCREVGMFAGIASKQNLQRKVLPAGIAWPQP